MTQNISGAGLSVLIASTVSFPFGFVVEEWADDTDPLTFTEIEPTGDETTIDGGIYTFKRATKVYVTLSVIPGSESDQNLRILLDAQKLSLNINDMLSLAADLRDLTIMTISYPDGEVAILSGGTLQKGPPLRSVMSSGRTRTNTYTFVFGSSASATTSSLLGTAVSIASTAGLFS